MGGRARLWTLMTALDARYALLSDDDPSIRVALHRTRHDGHVDFQPSSQ